MFLRLLFKPLKLQTPPLFQTSSSAFSKRHQRSNPRFESKEETARMLKLTEQPTIHAAPAKSTQKTHQLILFRKALGPKQPDTTQRSE